MEIKVLVADPLSEKGIELLKNNKNFNVDVKLKLKEEELIKIISDYNVLLVRSETKVTPNVLEAAKNLKLIGRAGVGVDNVNVSAASKKGIIVMNTPGGNTVSAAEHTMSMMLSLSRNIPQANVSLKKKEWNRKEFTGTEVKDKVLGIIGLGKIGAEVAKRAKAFGMNIFAYDPFVTKEMADKLGARTGSIEEVISSCDYLTLHIPLNDETRNLINKDSIAKMKDGVRIINVARGGIINEKDLAEAIKSGKVKGAAIDVFETEPCIDSPLFDIDRNVVVTPHLGASTEEAQINVAIEICRQTINYFEKNIIENAVNVLSVEPGVLKELSPFINLIEKIGSLQAQLLKGRITEAKIEYVGDIISYDVTPLTLSFFKGFLKSVEEEVNFVNIPVIIKERGIKVTESKLRETSEYINLITAKVITDNNERLTISGTVLAKKDLKIVAIDAFDIDAVPEGHLLICKNNDIPGVIGRTGTVLGEAKINIASMQVGRKSSGGEALIVINIDQKVPEKVVNILKENKDIISVKTVEL